MRAVPAKRASEKKGQKPSLVLPPLVQCLQLSLPSLRYLTCADPMVWERWRRGMVRVIGVYLGSSTLTPLFHFSH